MFCAGRRLAHFKAPFFHRQHFVNTIIMGNAAKLTRFSSFSVKDLYRFESNFGFGRRCCKVGLKVQSCKLQGGFYSVWAWLQTDLRVHLT
jgi:hypothetical protein